LESTVDASFTTVTGNLTLSPAGTVVIDKDATFTTGNVSSAANTPFTITPGNGEVYIGGNLNVQGSITTVNTSSLEVSDKTITLAHADPPSNINASGSGVVIEGDAWAAAADSKDLSLLWHNNTGGVPYWQLSGGDFYITRKIDGVDVTYMFMIHEGTQDLILKKQVGIAAPLGVAEFGV
jgi:hypothetical protein